MILRQEISLFFFVLVMLVLFNKKTNPTIKKIALNLGIETIELRTRESEDVKEYLQELEFDIIKLEYPKEFKEISNLIRQKYEKKVQELKNRKLLHRPANKISLFLSISICIHTCISYLFSVHTPFIISNLFY